MNADFPRILTLLRKEKSLSQKKVSGDLGVSQALLSHYEKGIRECGLDFLIKCADYYQVSCDYLLGRSPDRNGLTLTVDDIPEPDALGKENVLRGSILPVLNKKLIANSLNILFDLLQKSANSTLINEVSAYLMLSVYKMFRVVYSANPQNQDSFFTLPPYTYASFAECAMKISETRAQAVAAGKEIPGTSALQQPENLTVTTEILSKEYPLFASSLTNLIQNCEGKIKSSVSN